MLSLPLIAFLAAVPADGLAPLQPGVAQVGQGVDLVLRPTTEGCRVLLSDAQTDAPIVGAHVVTRSFGASGSAPAEAVATPGTYEGHYLFECPRERDGLVIELPQEKRPEVFALSMPAVPVSAAAVVPVPRRLPSLALIAAIGILLLLARRAFRVLFAVGVLLFVTTDAAAHSVDEAAVPVAPGTEIRVAQEIQFALELRTASVVVATFAPSGGAPAGASRQYPAVPATAVVERDGKKLVFIRLQPELFVGREVTLGWTNGEQVAVLSGLNPTERAVVSGAAFLRNGGASGP